MSCREGHYCNTRREIGTHHGGWGVIEEKLASGQGQGGSSDQSAEVRVEVGRGSARKLGSSCIWKIVSALNGRRAAVRFGRVRTGPGKKTFH
jgi:hypothetical protein